MATTILNPTFYDGYFSNTRDGGSWYKPSLAGGSLLAGRTGAPGTVYRSLIYLPPTSGITNVQSVTLSLRAQQNYGSHSLNIRVGTDIPAQSADASYGAAAGTISFAGAGALSVALDASVTAQYIASGMYLYIYGSTDGSYQEFACTSADYPKASVAYTPSVITFNGQTVNSVVFNGQAVQHLVFNGNTLY